MTIEFTDQEWEDLEDWIPVRSDSSYAGRIADLIADKISSAEE